MNNEKLVVACTCLGTFVVSRAELVHLKTSDSIPCRAGMTKDRTSCNKTFNVGVLLHHLDRGFKSYEGQPE